MKKTHKKQIEFWVTPYVSFMYSNMEAYFSNLTRHNLTHLNRLNPLLSIVKILIDSVKLAEFEDRTLPSLSTLELKDKQTNK